jgi:glutathione S-transferase
MSSTPRLLGFPVSPHVRAARLTFHEKAVAVDFEPIGFDALASADYGSLNPFRKMPVLRHGTRTLYETPALMVYADGMGGGAALEPADPFERARMWQFVGVAQNYLYPVGVMKLYFHAVLAPLFGMASDAQALAGAVAPTANHLDVIEAGLADGHLAGRQLTHADLYCAAMVDYIARTAEGHELLASRPNTRAWLDALRRRESFPATLASMLTGTDKSR